MSIWRWSAVLAMTGVIASQVSGNDLGRVINGGWFSTVNAARGGDEKFFLDAAESGEIIVKLAVKELTEASESRKSQENQRLSSELDSGVIPEIRIGEDYTSGELGALSKHFESKSNSAAIGYDRTGGNSYGAYQLASKQGSIASFIEWLKLNGHKRYAKALVDAGGSRAAINGKRSFKVEWVRLAQNREFYMAERAFIRDTHYVVQANILRRKGLDISARSHALRDVVWSTAVQHGGKTNVITRVYKNSMSDDELIRAIYAERAERFTGSTKKVRAAVQKRFVREERMALGMLKYG